MHKTSVVPQSKRNVHKNATVSHELGIPLNNRFELLGFHQDKPALHTESVGSGFESTKKATRVQKDNYTSVRKPTSSLANNHVVDIMSPTAETRTVDLKSSK